MMVVDLYIDTAPFTYKIRKNDNGQDTTGFVHQPRKIVNREIDGFYSDAVSASDHVTSPTSLTYMQQIEKWAKEFRNRKHNLSQEEIEALNSKIYLDLLETQNSLP